MNDEHHRPATIRDDCGSSRGLHLHRDNLERLCAECEAFQSWLHLYQETIPRRPPKPPEPKHVPFEED